MALQFANIVSIQIEFSCIHWKFRRKGSEVGTGALCDVLGPGDVMETCAVSWTAHFTVTGIIFTTVAKLETVGLVGAKEVLRVGIHQGSEGLVQGIW